tara:strand:- start:3847 stop:4116 length:270 start_codon:yes stop_codon:yes gene_type:complete
MRIQLTEDYAIHVKTLPEGTQLKCTGELGRELINKGVAVEIDVPTLEEFAVVDIAIAELEEADKKKHKPKKKKEQNLNLDESNSKIELD